MLDFRINTFLTVCRTMNFTRAAEALNLTQPAVSQHIRYLEEHYGVKLFQYSDKKLRLTKQGEILRRASMTLKHDEQHLTELLRSAQERKKLTFGATLTFCEYIFPDSLAAFSKAHPEISLCIMAGNTTRLLGRLENGEIDFALVEGYFEKSRYDYLPCTEDRLICVCAAGNPLADEERDWPDLFAHKLIIGDVGSGTREILERTLESQNYTLDDFFSVAEIGSIIPIKRMVELDCGISFIFEKAVEKELQAGILRKVEIRNFSITHEFHFIWHKNSIFEDYYRNLFQSLFPRLNLDAVPSPEDVL